MFAVANREIVTVSFDPFDAATSLRFVRMPLFILIFVLVVLGRADRRHRRLAAAGQWRARARRAEADVRGCGARSRASTRRLDAATRSRRTRGDGVAVVVRRAASRDRAMRIVYRRRHRPRRSATTR